MTTSKENIFFISFLFHLNSHTPQKWSSFEGWGLDLYCYQFVIFFILHPKKYFVKWIACDYDLCFVYENIRVAICVVMKTKTRKTRDKTVVLNSKSRLCSFSLSLSLSHKIDEWLSCSPDSNFFQTTKTDPFVFPGPPPSMPLFFFFLFPSMKGINMKN